MIRPAAAPALLFALFAPAALAQPAPASPTDADGIFREVDRRQDLVASERATIRMEIEDKKGRVRSRTMDLATKQDGDDQRSILLFSAPADIRGTGLLTIEQDGDDEQLLYLPALGRVQRIAGSARGDRFAGSDFTFEDLGARDPDDYDARLLETTDAAYTLEVRDQAGTSAYDRLVLTVDRERYTIDRAEYYDGADLAKVLTATDFEEVAPGAYRAGSLTMRDVREERETRLVFEDREVGAAVRDALFSERTLKRGRL
jgi:hypothetical protein